MPLAPRLELQQVRMDAQCLRDFSPSGPAWPDGSFLLGVGGLTDADSLGHLGLSQPQVPASRADGGQPLAATSPGRAPNRLR